LEQGELEEEKVKGEEEEEEGFSPLYGYDLNPPLPTPILVKYLESVGRSKKILDFFWQGVPLIIILDLINELLRGDTDQLFSHLTEDHQVHCAGAILHLRLQLVPYVPRIAEW